MSSFPARDRVARHRLDELLVELRHGHQESLAILLDLYRPYLLATARARLEDRLKAKAGPSDLVQETLIEANHAWQRLEEKPKTEEEFRLWLRNILMAQFKALRRRYYRAQRRSLSREWSLDDDESKHLVERLVADHSDTPSGRFDRKMAIERLEGALGRLAPAYRQIILWRNRDGWQFAKIGARMNRSTDAARMLWGRAMRQLKKELGVEDGGG
jgi:RNA polymerase sigma-70 factor, ECF subfamily